jgi:hypothetical protein
MYQFPMYYPPRYDADRARQLAALSAASYAAFEAEQKKATWTPPAGYDEVKLFHGGYKPESIGDWIALLWAKVRMKYDSIYPEIFGFVARRGGDVFLVFRGTDSLLDLLGDLHMDQVLLPEDMLPQPTPGDDASHWTGARLEHGVFDMYRTVRDEMLAEVNAMYARDRRLFVTGHSLGAGLAVAALPDLLRNTLFTGAQRPQAYTFAGPRVSNREFALALRGSEVPVFRVVHVEDVVPTMPGMVPLGFLDKLMKGHWYYAHVGTPVNFARAYRPDDECTIQTNHALATYIAALASDVEAGPAIAPAASEERPELGSRP